MIATDESALMCDLAETYHIYDYRSLPLQRVAIFSAGLREDSRIKMKMSGVKSSMQTMLLGFIVDRLSLLVWMQTKSGANGINRPKSILGQLLGEETDTDIESFNNPEDFERRRLEIISKGGTLNG